MKEAKEIFKWSGGIAIAFYLLYYSPLLSEERMLRGSAWLDPYAYLVSALVVLAAVVCRLLISIRKDIRKITR